MAKRILPADDAPESTAKDPNPAAAGLDAAQSEDTLVGRTVSINRPARELYEFWRDLRNLPLFMENIESIEVIDDQRSHWRVKGPADSTVEWDSIITDDVPGELIAWQSDEGAGVPNTGRIEFRESSNGRGTVVTATIAYDPPAGKIGKLFAKLFQREPKIQARRDLRRFKQLMETGEIPTSMQPEGVAMRALTWQGKHDVRVETVPDPQIVNPRDAIIRITSTAICGSDLHLYDHYIQGMKSGDVLGHEFMGEVVEVGSGNRKLKVGERVVVPFVIACGNCFFCQKQQFAACDNSNPADKSDASEIAYGYPMAAAFGYSHLTGGYSGGQAEYVRVPYSDVGPLVVPDGIDDDKLLFLSDILPTGWMAAVNCDIEPGDTVAVWGCGPVGLFAVQSALLLGAHRVIAIDHHPRRLALARQLGAEILDFEQVDIREALAEMTGGIGPDACIDAVGMESHGMTPDNMLDHVKVKTFMATDRVHALRQVILATRKGGRISIPGVYGGIADKFPIGALMEKGLTIKSGQTHVQKFMPRLLDLILEGKLDTTFLISHRLDLEEAADGYKNFKEKQNEYTKVVLKPKYTRH